MASRILGMGDVLSLVEEAERKVDQDKAEKLAKKLQKGKGFDLEDFRDQLQQMANMGGMASLLDKLPGMGASAEAAQAQLNDRLCGEDGGDHQFHDAPGAPPLPGHHQGLAQAAYRAGPRTDVPGRQPLLKHNTKGRCRR
jgi:hypothetical protein